MLTVGRCARDDYVHNYDGPCVAGGFIAGAVTDRNRSPGINCVFLLMLGTPMVH